MKKITKKNTELTSKNLLDENIKILKDLFPEISSQDKINFDVLKSLLGESVEEKMTYELTWPSKHQSVSESTRTSVGTLRPLKNQSLNWETTKNIYIEGDNLEVLKILQKTYSSKIKMIYIDPPYNTGKDFVYKDDYKDNLKKYLQITGQVDEKNYKLSSNTSIDGRYHSNWLSMMYPRLKLSRNLLKKNGVIFISIDDHEVENLKKICCEIFGESNFLCQFVWQKSFSPKNDVKHFSNSHEYILCFAKDIHSFDRNLLPREERHDRAYKNPDNDSRGPWTSTTVLATTFNTKSVFPIISPNGKTHLPPKGRCWRYSKNRINDLMDDDRLWFGQDGNGVPRTKRFLSEAKGIVPQSLLFYKEVGSGQDGTNDLKSLFDDMQIFDFPKPVKLIKHFLKISTTKDDIVLDFFAGSGTTSQAVLELNLEDNFNRKHIQVQLQELLDEKNEAFKAGFKTISDIGKERIRRVVSKIKEEHPQESKQMDLGFKVFKLDSSNIKSWDGNPENLEQNLFDAVDNIKSDRSEEDVLYEILLKYGLDLTLPIDERDIQGKKVFNVGKGSLFICLDNEITSKVAEGIGEWKKECATKVCKVIFKDNGFTDVEKTNSVQTLKRYGIKEIKSI